MKPNEHVLKLTLTKEINFVPVSRWEPGVLVSMVVTAMMTELFYVPRRGGAVLLAGLHDMLNTASGPKKQGQSLPKDPRTVCRQLHLDPVTETYLCCPTCWSLTPYCAATDNPVTNKDPNPDIPLCQDRATRESKICGEELWKKETIRSKTHCSPRLTYVHQRLKDWLGRLLSRPGIEEILDTYPITASHLAEGEVMTDIWSSPAIIGLKGPDGKPFLEGPAGEGRYLFSIATDGFNPFYNKTAKQSVTSTGIFAVLMNFPIELRHLLENMCHLGTAPSPNGPTVGRLNPFLDLVVRDFLEFWEPGVFFTRTYKYREGRQTKAMLIPLTADMLAARETAGFTSSTSTYFCIGCHIDMAHIEEFDSTRWPQRSHADHLRSAYAWKNAANLAEQQKIATTTGVRFSSILELPYWMAVRYVLVEPMHALELDMVDHHVRELFQIDLDKDGGDGSGPRVPRPTRPSTARITQILQLFSQHRNSSDSELLAKILKSEWTTYDALWHICNDNQLRVSGKKRSWLVLRIKKWVSLFLKAEPCTSTQFCPRRLMRVG